MDDLERKRLEISIQSLVGSQDATARLLADLDAFAVGPPIGGEEAGAAAVLLLSAGVPAERVLPIMEAVRRSITLGAVPASSFSNNVRYLAQSTAH
jgi:hypothetical protein